jgi:hypothetical protein
MATPNYDIGSVLSLKRNGSLESRQKGGTEEVEVCCWLADEFSAALEASQQCMI